MGLEKAEIEKLQSILKEKQLEVENVFNEFKSKLQNAIPPGSSVKYRGSLATGKKGPHKLTVEGAIRFFDPDDFDCDAFIEVSSDVWYNEITKINQEALSKEKLKIEYLASWSYYNKIASVMLEIEKKLSNISGYSIGDEAINLVVQTKRKSENQQQSGIAYPKGSLEKAGFPEHEKKLPEKKEVNEKTGISEDKIVLPEIHNTII